MKLNSSRASRHHLAFDAGVVGAALADGGFLTGLRSRPPERGVARFEIALPDGLSLLSQTRRALAIAPDDSAIALVAGVY